MNEETNNVINFPMKRGMRPRHFFNKVKDAMFEPEQVTYVAPKEEPATRTEHFETGQQEATIHSFRDQQIKRNMRAGDESVMRIINMEDPTKD